MLKKQILDVNLLVLVIVTSIFVFSLNAYGIEYTNEQWGIKFDYPLQFNLSSSSTDAGECNDENQCLIVFNKEGDPKAIITLLIQRGQQFQEECQCDSLLEFAQYEYEQRFEKNTGFSLINDNKTTLDGNVSATHMEYEITKNTDISRHIIIWTTINDIFYTINYHNTNEDFSALVPSFKGFLKSIEFSDPFEKIQPIQTEQEKKKPSFMMTDIQVNVNVKIDQDIPDDIIIISLRSANNYENQEINVIDGKKQKLEFNVKESSYSEYEVCAIGKTSRNVYDCSNELYDDAIETVSLKVKD